MYKKAVERKLRFTTGKGVLTVEQVRDLPLEHPVGLSLDLLEREYRRVIKDNQDVSIVVKKKKSLVTEDYELCHEILVDIIKDKMADVEKKETAAVKKTEADHLDRLIADAENTALAGLGLDELKARRAKL